MLGDITRPAVHAVPYRRGVKEMIKDRGLRREINVSRLFHRKGKISGWEESRLWKSILKGGIHWVDGVCRRW